MRRREFLGLSIAAAPLLFLRCAETPASVDLDAGRLHARPEDASAPAATREPQRLGLAAQRDGYYYIPRSAPASAPLLLFLHGATQSGLGMIRHLLDHADRTGTILLAPDSRSSTWGLVSGDEATDLAFIDDALEKIFTTCRIDPRRIGIGGFSDGASAALSWGVMNGDLFSAITAFSPGFIHLSAPPIGMPRIFISHGTRDSILPIDRCGRRLARELREAGYPVEFREFNGDHTVPPEVGREGLEWLGKG